MKRGTKLLLVFFLLFASFVEAKEVQQMKAVASVFEKGFLADYAVDGDFNTRWASPQGEGGRKEAQWFHIDFGKEIYLNKIVIFWEAAFASAFKVQLSHDLSSWTNIHQTEEGKGAIDTIAFSPQKVRFVKLLLFEKGGDAGLGYSIFEIKLFSPDHYVPERRPLVLSKEELEGPGLAKVVEKWKGKDKREKKLRKEVSFKFKEENFSSAVQKLSDAAQVNIVIDERLLEKIGNITLFLKRTPVAKALDILTEATGSKCKIEEHFIWISTPDEVVRKWEPLLLKDDGSVKALEKSVSFDLRDTGFVEAMRFLSQISAINIVVDEMALDVPPFRVNVRLKDVPLLEALELILRCRGLYCGVERGILWISTAEVISSQAILPLKEDAKYKSLKTPVNLFVKLASIKSIVAQLRSQSKLNLILDERLLDKDEVGKTTLWLRSVPLVMVLDILSRNRGLDYTVERDAVWITTLPKMERFKKVCMGSLDLKFMDARFRQNLPGIDLDNIKFLDLLRFLHDISGIDILIDEKVRRKLETKTTVHIRDLPFIELLEIVLRPKELGFKIKEKVIKIYEMSDMKGEEWFERGNRFFEKGEYAMALPHYRDIVHVFRDSKYGDEAKRQIEEVLEKEEGAKWWLHLGHLMCKGGEIRKARAYYKKVKKIYPHSELSRMAEKRLEYIGE